MMNAINLIIVFVIHRNDESEYYIWNETGSVENIWRKYSIWYVLLSTVLIHFIIWIEYIQKHMLAMDIMFVDSLKLTALILTIKFGKITHSDIIVFHLL